MAVSMPPSKGKEDFKEEFLNCSICTETFDNDQHKAKFLPCLHSFCTSCLRSHAGRRATHFNCPICRKNVALPGGTVNDLPNNFLVQNLKEYQDVINHAIPCGSCDEDHQAVGFCHDCECFLCQGCVDIHKKLNPLRNHSISTMAQLREKKNKTSLHHKRQRCEKHPTQDLTMYCKNCKVAICATCGLLHHYGHNLIDQTAAIDDMVSDIQRTSSQVNDVNKDLIRKCAEVEYHRDILMENFNKICEDMEESAKQLHATIDSRYEEVRSHLTHLYQSELTQLDVNTLSVEALTAQMTSACEFADNVCESGHFGQLLTSHTQIMTRLRELQNAQLPNEISQYKTAFAFTDQHSHAVTQIQELLLHLYGADWLHVVQSQRENMPVNIPTQTRTTPVKISSQGKGSDLELTDSLLEKSKSTEPFEDIYGPPKTPPQIDPRFCTIEFNESYNKRNVIQYTATVQAVDTDGLPITTGGAKVQATQNGITRQATDNNDGTFTFKYHRKHASQIHVQINNRIMKGSPFKLKIDY